MITSICCSLALSLSACAPAHYLSIGDPAPNLSAATWIKGSSQPKFEKKKVYVVEFWATWCGPCKENIPHLTELAAKYKNRVTVDGISIWETLDKQDPTYMSKVRSFVASEGPKMEYNVGADDAANTVANTWMKAAGESGIPTTFIVDGTGQVAWIGHPTNLEPILDQVLKGTWNVEAAKKQRFTDKEIVRPVEEAMAEKNYKQALAAIGVSLKKQPTMERFFTYDRLDALFHVDLDRAETESKQILKDSNREIGAYRMIVSIAASQTDMSPDAYKFGMELCKDALAKNEMKYMFLAMAAAISWNLHEKTEAVDYEKQAVDVASTDSHAPTAFVEFLKRNLKTYQAG